MNILIDTHILLWYIEGNKKLPSVFQETIESNQHNLFVSVASFWEIAIKISINKLKLNGSIEDLLPEGINILPINFQEASYTQLLPFHHTDPFDRLLIAQTIVNKMILMTVDEHIGKYEVELFE